MSEPPAPGALAEASSPQPQPQPLFAPPGSDRMHPRTAVLLVSSFAAVVLMVVLMLLPVPYVILRPGPALNTLGEVAGRPLISVSGRPTYPTSGALDLTTVTVLGGPGSRATLLQAVRGWLDRDDTVVPREAVYPEDQTAEESQAESQAEMVGSQETATVAALTELGIPVPATLTVGGFADKAPSAAVLREGDVVLGVGGVATPDLRVLQTELAKAAPGSAVRVQVRRAGKEQTLSVPTTRDQRGRTVLGIFVDPTFRFPFDVKIQIEDIGGPSAGTIFALGIIDKLTPGDLTGGKRVAGTGTIDLDGGVGPIVGIRQKMVGAHEAGARWFLAPAPNCNEVVGHVPEGMRVARIDTLHQARSVVETIAAGGAAADRLPSCG